MSGPNRCPDCGGAGSCEVDEYDHVGPIWKGRCLYCRQTEGTMGCYLTCERCGGSGESWVDSFAWHALLARRASCAASMQIITLEANRLPVPAHWAATWAR